MHEDEHALAYAHTERMCSNTIIEKEYTRIKYSNKAEYNDAYKYTYIHTYIHTYINTFIYI